MSAARASSAQSRKFRHLPLLAAAFLAVPVIGLLPAVEAHAQEADETYFFDYPKVRGKIGEKIDLTEWVRPADSSLCADDRYSDAEEDVVDVLGNNYSLVGATLQVRYRAVGTSEWSTLRSTTVTEDVVSPDCTGDPLDEDGPGSVEVDLQESEESDFSNWTIPVPMGRFEYDWQLTGPRGTSIASKSSELLPEYRISTEWWCPSGDGYCVDQQLKKIGLPKTAYRKGRIAGLRLEGDKRLVGLKVSVLLGSDRGADGYATSYRPIVSTRFKRSGKRALAILRWKIPAGIRKFWSAWRCIDYASKVPAIGPGKPCPTTSIPGSQFRSEFPSRSVSE